MQTATLNPTRPTFAPRRDYAAMLARLADIANQGAFVPNVSDQIIIRGEKFQPQVQEFGGELLVTLFAYNSEPGNDKIRRVHVGSRGEVSVEVDGVIVPRVCKYDACAAIIIDRIREAM